MTDIPYSPLIEQTAGIRARLGRLRRQLAAWLWIDGLGRLLWLALALFTADLTLDRFVRLDQAQRAIMLAIMLAALGWAIWKWLVRPLSASIGDDGLALQIEQTNPQLSQGLITSLQLSRSAAAQTPGISFQLLRHAVHAGTSLAQEVSFGETLDQRRGAQRVKLLGLAGLIWLCLVLALPFTSLLQTWLSRNIFLSHATWPQMTYLVIEHAGTNGAVVFPRGQEGTLAVRVTDDSRVVPSAIYLDFRPAGTRNTQALNRTGERQFAVQFAGVVEPFEFRVRGGDCVSEWTRLELVDPPALSDLKLTVIPPPYTGSESYPLEPGHSSYSMLPGSRLRVKAQANKPLVRAALVVAGEVLVPLEDQKVRKPPNSVRTLELIARQQAGFDVEISADKLVAGIYRFELTDTLGLTNRPQTTFTIHKGIDREPRVRSQLVGVSSMVVPQARMPISCQIEDDYGLTDVKMSYRWKGNDTAETPREGTFSFEQLRGPLSGTQVGRFSNLLELNFADQIDLAPLNIPPGASLSIHCVATDNNDVTGPQRGRSPELLLRIVTAEELRIDLLRRETQQRLELERLLKDQQALVTDSRALAASLANDAIEQLMQLGRRQQQIGQGTAAIADRLAAIASEIGHNRLEAATGAWQTRLSHEVVEPLVALTDQQIPEAEAALDQARRRENGTTTQLSSLTTAVALEQEIASRMKAIVDRLVKAEGYQEAVNLLYEIQQAQTEVNDQTSKARRDRIKKLLDSAVP